MSQCGDEIPAVDELALIQFNGSAANTVRVRATLWGVTPDAGGTVTYTVYPDNSCTTGAQEAGTVAVTNGIAPSSNDIALPGAGSLYWSASYSGDANNHAVVSNCQGPQFAPANFPESLPTTPSPGGPAGTVIYDTASPMGTDGTGSVQFMLFGPGDPNCWLAIYSATVTLVDGTATSPGFATSVPGTYRWGAYYDGGGQQAGVDNSAATYECTDATVITAGPPGWTSTGSDVSVATTPAGSTAVLNVVFGEVDTGGVTSATVTTSGPASAGFNVGSSPAYYDITTTVAYSGPITVCLPYSPSSYADPSKVRLYHYDVGAWVDVTSSVDTATNTVCGTTTSLSPFVVGQPLQQAQSITFGPPPNQTYGTAPLTLSARATSGLPVAYSASGQCTVAGATLTIIGAGSCTVTASQAGNDTWLAATPVSQSFTIAPAPLTISAVSASRAYGVANPIFIPTYSGFVAGDTAASLTTAPTCTTAATSSSPVGTYPITCSGAVDSNYSFTYVPGTLTIAIADRFVTPTNTTLSVGAPGFLALTSAPGATVVVSTQPAGKLTLGSGGAFTYVPKTGFSGTDSFAYRLNINGSLSAPVTVTIYVVGTGMNCSKCNLSGLTVSGVNLTGANLSSANLTGARLTSANLTGANLSSAALSYATLTYANLTGANLSAAALSYAALDHANLTGANLSSAVLSNASLTYANLTGANLAKATLTGANLTGATLTGANLTGANMSGATLQAAAVAGVAWSNTVCPDSTNSSKDGGTCVGHLGP